MNWTLLGLICVTIGFVMVCLSTLYLIKRLDNADARIKRLEDYNSVRKMSMTKAIEDGTAVKLRCPPDPSCKKCHGRGFIGRNRQTGLVVPCTCCV